MHHGGVETTVVSDAALASLAQGGDLEALAVLLERHRPSLYAAAVGLLGNRADALDVVQDTFVVALLRLADLRDANAVGRGCMPCSAISAACASGNTASFRLGVSSYPTRCPGPRKRSNNTSWASGYGTRWTT
jgi:sigma-70-like protein